MSWEGVLKDYGIEEPRAAAGDLDWHDFREEKYRQNIPSFNRKIGTNQDLDLFEVLTGIKQALHQFDGGDYALPKDFEERRKEGVDILYKISQHLQTQMQKQRGN